MVEGTDKLFSCLILGIYVKYVGSGDEGLGFVNPKGSSVPEMARGSILIVTVIVLRKFIISSSDYISEFPDDILPIACFGEDSLLYGSGDELSIAVVDEMANNVLDFFGVGLKFVVGTFVMQVFRFWLGKGVVGWYVLRPTLAVDPHPFGVGR